MNYVQNLADDLFMQLGICRVGDILLLNSRIDKSNVMMVLIIIFVIDTNAFLENEFYPLFSNAMANSSERLRRCLRINKPHIKRIGLLGRPLC